MDKCFTFVIFLFIVQLIHTQQPNDTLIVAYTPAAPFIIEEDDRLEGINIWLWEQIANDLNLVYELKPMDFSDMLQAVKEGTVDVSINPLTITSDRSKTMEFTHSFFASNSTVAITKASSLQQFFQYINSFLNLNFLRGFFILILFIFLFGAIAWHFEKHRNPEQFRPGWKGLFDGIWWSVVTMTTVGYGDKAPRSRGGKMVALVWMFSGLLFISGLTASVASSLTVDKLSNTAEDFNEFKERKIGSVKNSSSTEFLKINFFRDVNVYSTVVDGLNDLTNENIDAFMYDEPILKYRIKHDEAFNNLQVLPIKYDLQFYAFGLPKDRTALEQAISQKILELIESHEWRVVLNEYNLNQI